MKTDIPFKCPYNEFSCVQTNTCGMSVEKSCNECEHYHNGVKATGAMPTLALICKTVTNLFHPKV